MISVNHCVIRTRDLETYTSPTEAELRATWGGLRAQRIRITVNQDLSISYSQNNDH